MKRKGKKRNWDNGKYSLELLFENFYASKYISCDEIEIEIKKTHTYQL